LVLLSSSYVSRLFKQTTGFSLSDYISQCRLDKAKELLGTGRYSVNETAELCGFESAPHFSDTFRKTTGCSPGDYKKKC
jgi:two-component system response regulator YesN